MIGAGSFAVDIGDPDSTRTVWAIVALLVVLGIGLVMLAFWLRRSTRPDPEYLAPLELMGERTWRRGDPVWQRRRLDEVRPRGAEPLRRSAAPPRLDASFDDGPSVGGFDDLQDDAHIPQTGADAEEVDDERDTPAATPVTVHDADGDDPTQTPIGSSRPFFEDLPDHEMDPDELRRAMEALDAELQSNRDD